MRTGAAFVLALAACHSHAPSPPAAESASAAPAASTASIAASIVRPSSSAAPSSSASSSPSASAVVDEPTPSTDQRWCLSPSGLGEDVNGVVKPPLAVSGAQAAARLAASSYAKALAPKAKKLDIETYYCPDPKRCAAAKTLAEKRATCDYDMRVYVYDESLRTLGGRPVMYLDIDDHVDAMTGLLWRQDGASWASRPL